MAEFCRNAWYVGALGDELGDAPLGRTLLCEKVVFFRTGDGTAAAVTDRCPHRFVSLSMGTVEQGRLVCGYHGLCFDSAGTCVDERFNEQVRSASKIRSYDVVEKSGLIWIWMGNEPAQLEDIPDFSCFDEPGIDVISGLIRGNFNYLLEIDNLMDLSHLDYLHRNSIGNGSLTTGEHKSWQEGTKVYSNWWSPDSETPHQYRAHFETPNWRSDSWYDMCLHAPGSIHLYAGVTGIGRPKAEGFAANQGHFVTPETETSTHYFYVISRPDVESPEDRENTVQFIRNTFEQEDTPMLEAQQRAMKSLDFWAERPVVLPEDSGAIRARRLIERLVRKENSQAVSEDEFAAIAAE